MNLRVLIPTYNGLSLLHRYLPGVVREFGAAAITLVDDCSTDDTVSSIRDRFPEVELIKREVNGGFSSAVNDGIRAIDSELVILFNNDVEVTPGFLDSILPLFDDENVFAVTPRIILPAGNGIDEGAKTGFWRHGVFFTDQQQDVREVSTVLYATACAVVYRKSMLDALGGLDPAYSPFYWEDADLCYRAWKRGWKTLYQPASMAYHQHSASIGKIDSRFTGKIKARNSLFFIWRNIEDKRLLHTHRLWLPFVLARKTVSDGGCYLSGWCEARARRDEAISARMADSGYRKLSDLDIFKIVGVRV